MSLDRRCDKMAVMRQARGERRAVIEDVGLSVPGLFERTFEDAFAPPELEHFQFGGNEIERVTARRCDGGGQAGEDAAEASLATDGSDGDTRATPGVGPGRERGAESTSHTARPQGSRPEGAI